MPHTPSTLQVACGDGLVRIYNFLRSDEPSQYPQVGGMGGQGGADCPTAFAAGSCGLDCRCEPFAGLLRRQGILLERHLQCHTFICPCRPILPPSTSLPLHQDRMDRSKEVTPADVTRGALDKSDPVAGGCERGALLLLPHGWTSETRVEGADEGWLAASQHLCAASTCASLC